MPNLKEIKNRISSVKKTRQITSAMKLVAGAKLKRATETAMSARPYQAELSKVLARVAAGTSDVSEPLLIPHDEVKKILAVVITSDRGLCGGFNSSLLRRAQAWAKTKQEEGIEVELRSYGRKAADFLKNRSMPVAESTIGYDKTPKMDLVRPLCATMTTGYTSGDYDAVYLIYNRFINVLSQTPLFSQVIPAEIPEHDAESGGVEHRYEPANDIVLGKLLPLYLRTQVLQAFLETEAGEHAARMTAMDNATRNAGDIIDNLTLDYNRARQAAITNELIEIVSGAEAL